VGEAFSGSEESKSAIRLHEIAADQAARLLGAAGLLPIRARPFRSDCDLFAATVSNLEFRI
jgi:hypothetical protein